MSYPKICPICGGELGGPSSHSDWCGTCMSMYNNFNERMPEEWKKVAHGRELNYRQWRAIMLIKKAVFDGKISVEEGKRQTKELALNIEASFGYGPRHEERIRQCRARAGTEPHTVFNSPSLLEW